MHHGKHQKRNKRRRQFLFALFLASLISLEIYLLFFQQAQQQTLPQTSAQQTQTPQTLQTDVEQMENFNQEVQPNSDFASKINQKLIDGNFIGTALVIKDGQIILQKGFGHANSAKNIPNTSQSLFQLGSIQKAFTAAMILQQVQAKKITLDETLNRFYPTVPDSSKITIRQLLSMSSGLYQKEKPKEMMSDEGFIKFEIASAQMGTYGKYKYEPINYYLLVGILEQVTGTAYRTLFNQTFKQHLQLSHTEFYDDFLHSPNRTYSYEKTNNQDYGKPIEDNPLNFDQEVGTGSVGMTVGDLYLFYSRLLSGGIVDQQIVDSLWTPETQDKYMGGMYNYGNYIHGHGVQEGFETCSCVSKDRKNAVILFTNQYPKNANYNDLTKSIFRSLGPYKIRT